MERSRMLGPIVECRRIEVGSIRPNNSMDLRVESDLGKDKRIAEGTIKFPFENWLKIDGAGQSVVEAQFQSVGHDVLDGGNAINGMGHDYCNGIMGDGLRPPSRSCQSIISSSW